jgi:hypothetical protein
MDKVQKVSNFICYASLNQLYSFLHVDTNSAALVPTTLSMKNRPTVFYQAEVYAIKACAVDNLDRNYKNRNTYILSESQAAIKALDKHQTTSKLVWDCHQSLIQLAKHNRVQLIWVSGHEGINGNETADQLARTVSEHPFIGPEPACGISIGVAKKAVRD